MFHVPNDYLFEVCDRHPEFLPAASIHPARHDALDELERCLVLGARALKLLPNCHDVDCSDPRFDAFWERMASAGLPVLCLYETYVGAGVLGGAMMPFEEEGRAIGAIARRVVEGEDVEAIGILPPGKPR